MGTIKYALVPRKHRETGEVRAYANIVTQPLSFGDLAEQASAETTVTKTDCVAVVRVVLDIAKREILKGNTIQLGDLGTIFSTLSSTGVDDVKHFDASMIKKVNLRFRPSTELKTEMAKATFEYTVTKKRLKESMKSQSEAVQEAIDNSAGGDQP